MPIPLRLTVERPGHPPVEHRFERDLVKIGRLASAHLKLDDSRVSRIHAVIEAGTTGQDYAIIDMGSTEGTFVNGRRISKEKLSDGDDLSLGDYRIRVRYGEELVESPTTADVLAVAPDPQASPAVAAGWVVPAGYPVPGQPMPAHSVPSPPMPGWAASAAAAGWSAGPQPPEASGVYPAPGASGVYPAPGASGVYPAPGASGVYPASGVYAAPGASGVYPAPGASGVYPAPGASGVYPIPPAVPASGVAGTGDVAPNGSSWGYHPGWSPPTVPNNLASASVPDNERALEIKLIWGSSVLDTVTVTDQPKVTLGDERRVAGFGPLQRVVRCDLEVPSKGLPSKTHVLAERQGPHGVVYQLHLSRGMSGRVERADGLVVSLELLFQGQHGGEPDGSGGVSYMLRAEETVYISHGELMLQIRYVRRTRVVPLPLSSRINYAWANILLLAFFFHALAIGTFLASPEPSAQLTDELYKNRNRFIETRLKLAEQKRKSGGGVLAELEQGARAQGKDGKMGQKEAAKDDGRVANKGRPDDKDRARQQLDKLLGLGGKGSASSIFGGSGTGGALEAAVGGLQGRQVGDARGLGGLGTRGTGPGGGGLTGSSVGLGLLGTAGRGGGLEGGAGYGQGAASLGGKRDRDIEISASAAIVRGSLSKEIIRRVVQKHMAQIRYCYEKELQRSPGLFGKVATEFVIDGSGAVIEAKVYESTMNDAEVESCISSKIRGWKFPKPEGGGIVLVKYPFLFKASG